jgi:hypothetical protein
VSAEHNTVSGDFLDLYTPRSSFFLPPSLQLHSTSTLLQLLLFGRLFTSGTPMSLADVAWTRIPTALIEMASPRRPNPNFDYTPARTPNWTRDLFSRAFGMNETQWTTLNLAIHQLMETNFSKEQKCSSAADKAKVWGALKAVDSPQEDQRLHETGLPVSSFVG